MFVLGYFLNSDVTCFLRVFTDNFSNVTSVPLYYFLSLMGVGFSMFGNHLRDVSWLGMVQVWGGVSDSTVVNVVVVVAIAVVFVFVVCV